MPTLLELARLPELSSLHRALLLMLIVYVGRGRDTCWDGYVPWETVERCAAAVEAVIPDLTNWGCSTDDAVVHAAALAAAAYFPTPSEGRLELLAPDNGDPQLLAVRHLLEAKARGDLTAKAIGAAAAINPDVADYAAEADQDDPSFDEQSSWNWFSGQPRSSRTRAPGSSRSVVVGRTDLAARVPQPIICRDVGPLDVASRLRVRPG